MKWTKRLAFHFMEESLLNAHILYKKSGGRKPLLKFNMDCISTLLAASSTDPMAPDDSARFSGQHFPELIPPTLKKQTPQKKREVCSKEG